MLKTNSRWLGLGFRLLGVVLALAFTTIILVLSGAQPFEAYGNLIAGSVGSNVKISETLATWVPLILATSGLLVTFSAGLWNIGIEGQITIGAIFTTFALRTLDTTGLPPAMILIIGFLAGALGGALWAAIVGWLKIYGGVSEIFGGLGLNFVSTAFTLWLIFGPWKRPGVGSMSGTEPFRRELWLPMAGDLHMSLWSLGLGIAGVILIYLVLNGTYFGLRLKAVGKNGRAAFLMGIPTNRYMMSAFLICGAFAGLVGAVQVTEVRHGLIPSISSGYGFLGVMVGMLVNYQILWAVPVTFFFAALNIGSSQLPIVMQLDSTLTGVLQGALVLFVLMVDGVRRRLSGKS